MLCIDCYVKVDLRTVSFDVPPQEVFTNFTVFSPYAITIKVLSRDSVTVSVEAVVYYRVRNPTLAVKTFVSCSLFNTCFTFICEDKQYRGLQVKQLFCKLNATFCIAVTQLDF